MAAAYALYKIIRSELCGFRCSHKLVSFPLGPSGNAGADPGGWWVDRVTSHPPCTVCIFNTVGF